MKFTLKDFLNPGNNDKELPYDPETTGQGQSPIASGFFSDVHQQTGHFPEHEDTQGYDSTFQMPDGTIRLKDLSELATKHGLKVKG